ncbi:MAG: YggS family pyridoxal phosphate-dependent enzyme, partial [Clostridiales bacterium]|nr:YggS family pyridoxal phosphate-dependent enzyme [Clostridiales bacterium]
KGLMTVAPYDENPGNNRIYFRKMRELFVDIKAKNCDNIDMTYLSMGMTNDYIEAIEEGADIVRIGTGIFGKRNYN